MPRNLVKIAVSGLAIATVAAAALIGIADPRLSRATALEGVVLVLWLAEILPLYATTMVFWFGCVLVLAPLDPVIFGLPRVLSRAASPVMVLFFGGFALSVAGSKYGIDCFIAGWMVRLCGGSRAGL